MYTSDEVVASLASSVLPFYLYSQSCSSICFGAHGRTACRRPFLPGWAFRPMALCCRLPWEPGRLRQAVGVRPRKRAGLVRGGHPGRGDGRLRAAVGARGHLAVGRHDTAAIWVAFFSRWERYEYIIVARRGMDFGNSFVVLFMACVGLRINFTAEAERAQARARSAQSLGKG